MKRIYLTAVLLAGLFVTACSDSNGEKDSTTEKKQVAPKKEESKTSISISKDSVGITTKKGDKVEVSKDGGGVENKDTRIKVKSDG